MKKFLHWVPLAVLCLVLVLLLPNQASAATSGYYTYKVSNGKATITDVNTAISGDVTIPSTLGGYPVTSIGSHAFEDCNSLTSVTIGDSVTSIGYQAFQDCTSLTSVTIPDSVTSIGYMAFYDCESLTSVTIGNSVTSIGSWAFDGCTSLTSVTIPDSVTAISESAFRDCYRLTSVTIGDSVTSIGSYAFDGCSSLTSVTIPDSVTSIGKLAFDGCTSLTSITIPDSVTDIGDNAFYNCASLTSVTIPDSVTSIGDSAFSSCYRLTSVTIGNSVTSIGSYAFRSCGSLTGIWVDEENPAYCSDEYGVLYNKNKTTLIQAPDGIQGSYTIPDSVTRIVSYAFYYCDSLTSVTIGNSVTSIGEFAFYDCDSLTSVTIGDSVTSIGLQAFDECTSLTSITIPDSVTSISHGAFSSCTSLTSITIPDSVTSIGDAAFSSCTSLTSVTIGNSVTSIGTYAFSKCTSLTSVTIPDSVTSIGYEAFYVCHRLQHVVYGGTSAQWGKISIGSNNTSLTGASVWHYGATQDDVHYTKNCINAGLFCDLCNDFLTREKAESGEHSYENDTDTYCDDCGYTRSVKGIAIGQYPTKRYYSLLTDELDVTGGTIKVTYSDGSTGEIAITEDMITGFNNRVYGRQSLKITYCDKRAYYTIINQANHTPDKLEVLKNPNQVSYLVNDTALWDGLTLKATYEDVEVEIPVSDVKVDKVDMTTAGIKTVTVRFYDAIATFPLYVHEMQQQTIDSRLYPESKHNYAANSDDTKIFTYPGAGSLVLTFSAQSYMETNCDYIYILDRMGNQIGQYTGSLANVVVTVPGDTVQIRLVSDDSVNKYGYAFSSITTEAITHPGEDFCEICGELKTAAGKIVLPENMSAVNMTIPAGVTIDLNGHILTVDSLASFGQIIDSVGGGGLIVENIEISGNDWLPIQDSTGCYRFYEYEMDSLGSKETTAGATFGFTLEFADTTAYSALMKTADAQLTVTLSWGENTKTVAFSVAAIQQYRKLQRAYPNLQPAMLLKVTGLDSLEDGEVLTVTPAVTAMGGKLQTTGAPMTFTA